MFILRYGEIALKGRNRRRFEELLANNIVKAVRRKGFKSSVKVTRGRILVYASDDALPVFSRIPGVVSYSPAVEMEYGEVFPYLERVLEGRNPRSFKVETQRIDKTFPKKSPEINAEIGEFVVKRFGWKVDLESPELTIGVEIINSKVYVFFERYPGVGGLPVGSAGKLLLLLSPGIDSPVAGFMMMRRGAKIIALHLSSGGSEEKVREYVRILSECSPKDIELRVIPHREILEKYAKKLKEMKREEWTCVVCKYLMLRTAERVARETGALGIITGDSLGQVASQTLHNLYVISKGIGMPIYRPLVGMDKVDIERIAKEIGTYDVFLSHEEEKCPFRPRHVVTEASEEKFRNVLKKIGL